MARRPAGAAAQRLEVAEGSRELPMEGGPLPLWAGRAAVVATAGLVAVTVGLSRDGMPFPLGIALVLAALAAYALSLRLGPTGAGRPSASWRRLHPALVPATCVVGAVALLRAGAGSPWTWAVPAWAWLVLGAGPWLDRWTAVGRRPGGASTALSVLLVTLPVPYFLIALTPGLPAALAALAVGGGCLVPTWRMVRLSGLGFGPAWERAAIVAFITAVGLTVVAHLQVTSPLLPVATLVGWYGLTGIASLRDRSELPSFAAFVVLAAAILAISAPA